MEGGARDARQPSVATQEKENKERAPGRQQPHNQTATAPSTILKTRATITMRGVRLASALPPHANGEAGRAATEGPQTVITSHFGPPPYRASAAAFRRWTRRYFLAQHGTAALKEEENLAMVQFNDLRMESPVLRWCA